MWVITHCGLEDKAGDPLGDLDAWVGIGTWYGPVNQMRKALPHRFRLLDDDENVYLYGRSDDSSSFDPMDYFMEKLGVTSIEYIEAIAGEVGSWEKL